MTVATSPALAILLFPSNPPQMRAMNIEYDPWRGGFSFSVGAINRLSFLHIFDNLFTLYPAEDGKIMAFESSWDHGGYPLAGLQHADSINHSLSYNNPRRPFAQGLYLLTPDGSHSLPETVTVTQTLDYIDLRFRCPIPYIHATVHHAIGKSLMVWLVYNKVIRVQFAYSALASGGPIEALNFSVTDFK